ncbi:transposase [Microbacterium murale]|uniref:Transposase n=1 Tax=Microbacterium murale TaxID=1081040 RepID=A0ABU0P3U7_9MICO|nr:transposase [Microbacterium murale]MDQ0641998.1 hypothetical protein [Microbacterium murale]
MTAESTLAEIAAALYAGPPDDFVAVRNAHAKAASDRDVAQRVRALRKPSVAAWVVNVFARERSDELGEALQLAAELREAQADLDAQALAQLGRQRRALTIRLAKEAADLAASRGERITPATLDAVQQTINAAFFDPDAAAAVASGRLIRELRASSALPLEMDALVAGGLTGAAPPPADELSERRQRRQAERAVHDAEEELAGAERDLAKAESDRSEANRRAEEFSARIGELEAELERTRHEHDRARSDIDAADQSVAMISEQVSRAERSVHEMRHALDE